MNSYGAAFSRDEHGQDWGTWYGRNAVRLARACAARARRDKLWDTTDNWERWAVKCALDPLKPLKVRIPPGVVRYERHSRGIFGPPAATMFDEGGL